MPRDLADFDEITIGTEVPFDEDVRLPDGTVGHFHLENPVVDDNGKVIGFVISFHAEDDEDGVEHGHETHYHG